MHFDFEQEYYRSDDVSSKVHYIKGYVILKCLIPGETDIDHLVKIISAQFLCCEVIFFSLQYINYLKEIFWDCKYLISPQTSIHQFYHPLVNLTYKIIVFFIFVFTYSFFEVLAFSALSNARVLFFHFYFFISLGAQYIGSQRRLFKCKFFFYNKESNLEGK